MDRVLIPSDCLCYNDDLPLQFSTVDLDQALFQPFPSEIVFQNYVPCETYEVPLVLRNNDKVRLMMFYIFLLCIQSLFYS